MKTLCRYALIFGIALVPFMGVVSPSPSVSALAVYPSLSPAVADSTAVRQEVVANLKISWPWYVIRAAGMVAAALLILLMLSGIGLITGLTYRIMEPLVAWRLHRALGLAFAGSVVIHIVLLLIDKFVSFNVLQVLLPFTSSYMPLTIGGLRLGSFGVALGVFAFYAAAVIVVSSLLYINKKPALWRLLHYLSYALVILVFFHALLIGTDLKGGLTRIVWYGAGSILILGILSRLRRARTLVQRGKDKEPR